MTIAARVRIALLRKSTAIPVADKTVLYEDRLRPPVGSQGLPVRYSPWVRKLASTM